MTDSNALTKEESSREAWLESMAATCQADDKPCDGCQQGGVCDGTPNSRSKSYAPRN